VALEETRQSTDDDLTTRAFYAAESGFEDAKRAVRQFIKSPTTSSISLRGDSCDHATDANAPNAYTPELSSSDEFDSKYTCQLIDITPPNYEVELGVGESKQINLLAENNQVIRTVTVEWHLNEDTPDGDGLTPPLRNSSDTSLPIVSDWNLAGIKYPAMLRAHIFSYPSGAGGISRANLANTSDVAFLNPINGLGSGNIAYSSAGDVTHDVYNASCDNSSTDYVCSISYNIDSTSRSHVLRLSTLYAPTHVRVSLYDGTGTLISFQGSQAIIDVTGQAGDVYRRIETRVDLNDTFANLIPDNALLSADDICKNLVVGNVGSVYQANDCSR